MSRFDRQVNRWARNQSAREQNRHRAFAAREALGAFARGEGNRELFRSLLRAPEPSIDPERRIVDFFLRQFYERSLPWFEMSQQELATITREDVIEAVRIWIEQSRSFARSNDPFCTTSA